MEWISILKCPVTGQDLRLMNGDEIIELNELINNGKVWQADGKVMQETLSEALVTTDGVYHYPMLKGVVLLLPDLALVKNKEKILGDSLSDDKKLVKNFYDDRGWHTNEKGDYEDAEIFEDVRPFAQPRSEERHVGN